MRGKAPCMGVSIQPNLHQGHGGYVALFRGTLHGRRQCLHAENGVVATMLLVQVWLDRDAHACCLSAHAAGQVALHEAV